MLTVPIRPQDWVLVFFLVSGIALAAAFGWSIRSLLAVLAAAVVLVLVHLRLQASGASLWQGLCLTAAWNPAGDAWIGSLIVLPRLLLAAVFATTISLVGLPLPRDWTYRAWRRRLAGARAGRAASRIRRP